MKNKTTLGNHAKYGEEMQEAARARLTMLVLGEKKRKQGKIEAGKGGFPCDRKK